MRGGGSRRDKPRQESGQPRLDEHAHHTPPPDPYPAEAISLSINHVCLDCKRITPRQTRCEECDRMRQQHRNASRTHLHGSYKREAKRVRDSASHCWLCGEGPRLDDPFTADHVVASDPHSPLMPAHRSCNSRRGNKEASMVATTSERVPRAPGVIPGGCLEDA